MPHRPRTGRDGSPEFERYITPLSRSELNMRFLNNPRLSKNQRQFIIHTYRKAHPEETRRERKQKRFEKRKQGIRKERQRPRGSRRFEQLRRRRR